MPQDIFTINPDLLMYKISFRLIKEGEEFSEKLELISFYKNDTGEIILKGMTSTIILKKEGSKGFFNWHIVPSLIIRNCLPMKMKLTLTNSRVG